MLGGALDLAFGFDDVFWTTGDLEDWWLVSARGLDVGVGLGAKGFDLAA